MGLNDFKDKFNKMVDRANDMINSEEAKNAIDKIKQTKETVVNKYNDFTNEVKNVTEKIEEKSIKFDEKLKEYDNKINEFDEKVNNFFGVKSNKDNIEVATSNDGNEKETKGKETFKDKLKKFKDNIPSYKDGEMVRNSKYSFYYSLKSVQKYKASSFKDKLKTKVVGFNEEIDMDYKFEHKLYDEMTFGSVTMFKSGYTHVMYDEGHNLKYTFKHDDHFTSSRIYRIYDSNNNEVANASKDEMEDTWNGNDVYETGVRGCIDKTNEYLHLYLPGVSALDDLVLPSNVIEIHGKRDFYSIIHNVKFDFSHWPIMVYKNGSPYFRAIGPKDKKFLKTDVPTIEYNDDIDFDEAMAIFAMVLLRFGLD